MDTPAQELYFPPRERDVITEVDGLFYRGSIPEKDELLDLAQNGNLSLVSYQKWVEAGWKTPFLTQQSAQRLQSKLEEELGELLSAYGDYRRNQSESNRQHLTEEAGDVMWVLTAISSNGGIALSTMVELSVTYDEGVDLTLNQLDKMTSRNTVDDVEQVTDFAISALVYGQKGQVVHHIDESHPLPFHKLNVMSIAYAQALPQLLATLASILEGADSSLPAAVTNNIQKLSERRTTNTIDKTDPGRT